MTKENFTQDKLQKYTEQLIARMENMSKSWQCGWMGSKDKLSAAGGMPTNLEGRAYNGMNAFFLFMVAIEEGYRSQTWMTLKQANKVGLSIKKGQKSSDVFFWKKVWKDEDGNTVSKEDMANMTKEELSHLHSWGILKFFPVFNVEQTNMDEKDPERFAALVGHHTPSADTEGMYANDELDSMFKENGWLCPIIFSGNRAYYTPVLDNIHVPCKKMFKVSKDEEGIYADGQEFYSTAIHEMMHSTGSANRLNREGGKKFGDKKYAKEELVAELSAAVIGASYGFVTRVQDNNAAYLKGWIASLKEEPKFLVSVLADVSKAVAMFTEQLEKVSKVQAVA